jgi:hypothetical protein
LPATALELAKRQWPALQQFAQQWDAAAARTRGLARRRRPTLLPPEENRS